MSVMTPAAGPQRDDSGTLLVVTIRRPNGTAIDLTGMTTATLRVRYPSGRTEQWSLNAYATPPQGQVSRTVAAGDLNEPGHYEAQAFIQFSAKSWRTRPFEFVVGDNL